MTGLDRQRVLTDIAATLDVPAAQLDGVDDLVDAGLDSIRIMMLVERWRAGGADVDFAELAENPDLAHWLAVLDV